MQGTAECDTVLRDLSPVDKAAPNAPLGEQWPTLAILALTLTGFPC